MSVRTPGGDVWNLASVEDGSHLLGTSNYGQQNRWASGSDGSSSSDYSVSGDLDDWQFVAVVGASPTHPSYSTVSHSTFYVGNSERPPREVGASQHEPPKQSTIYQLGSSAGKLAQAWHWNRKLSTAELLGLYYATKDRYTLQADTPMTNHGLQIDGSMQYCDINVPLGQFKGDKGLTWCTDEAWRRRDDCGGQLVSVSFYDADGDCTCSAKAEGWGCEIRRAHSGWDIYRLGTCELVAVSSSSSNTNVSDCGDYCACPAVVYPELLRHWQSEPEDASEIDTHTFRITTKCGQMEVVRLDEDMGWEITLRIRCCTG